MNLVSHCVFAFLLAAAHAVADTPAVELRSAFAQSKQGRVLGRKRERRVFGVDG